MIRVLHIGPNLANGGIEAMVMNVYRHIDRSEVQFDFLATHAERRYYDDEIEALGGKIHRIPAFRRHPFKNMRLRKKIMKQYDVVEFHAMHAWQYGYCKSAKRAGVKSVIFHVHGTPSDRGLFVRYARKQILKYCDEIVTCSQSAARTMLGRDADKVIRNAIDPQVYAFDPAKREEIRAHYQIPDGARVVGTVGRFVEVKNQAFLIDCFAEAAAKRDDLYLILKGFGKLRQSLEEQVHALGLERRVFFADEYEASALYNAFDLFVLPSKNEGLGIVAIEAQANGLPVLLSDAVPRESNIGGDVNYLPLEQSIWAEEMQKERPRVFIADFSATGYDIAAEAAKRQQDYLRLAGHTEA